MKKKFPWLVYLFLAALIAAVALAPVASITVAGAVANAHGCQLDKGSAHPCMIAGHDYGELLYTLGVLGWLMLLTLPAGAIAGLLWLLALIIHYVSWKNRSMSAA